MKETIVVAPEKHSMKMPSQKSEHRRRWIRVRGAAVQILSFVFRLFLGVWIILQVRYTCKLAF